MERNANEIEPEDVLLALARGQLGVGRRILEALSVHLEQMQDELARLVPHRPRGLGWKSALAFSAEALHALAWAKEEAASLGHNYLGTEHIVLGILRDPNSRAAKFLREQHATIESARDAVRTILGEQ